MSKIKITILLSFLLVTLSACFNSNKNNFADAKKLMINQPCLPVKGDCQILLDNDIKLHLKFMAAPSYQRLLPITLESSEATIENISIQMLIDGKEMPSEKMKMSENKKNWVAQLLPFAAITKDNLKIRLMVTYKATLHLAEFSASY